MKTKIIKSERIQYFDICPICKKEIKGFSLDSWKLNMKSHMEKHERKKDINREEKNNG